MIKVTRYTSEDKARWDQFVSESRNATFLLLRDYMDYHSTRFIDHSILVHDAKGALLALLPANQHDGTLQSHGGLTYGGVISAASMTTPTMLEVFDAVVLYLREQEFKRLTYKTIPSIYHRYPAEEDRYALFRLDARLTRRDVLSVIAQDSRIPFQKRRQRRIAQATKLALEIRTAGEFGPFWAILEENLAAAHGVKPVHTLDEIQMLAKRFPQNIRLHVCLEESNVVAGVVVFDTGQVAHMQYISTSLRGRETGALDLLFATLIERDYAQRAYFDFGISNEDNGRHLNVGLIEQKEGFGARAVVHDFYELTL
ncbi:acetyltransferase (GNAT) family protein [Paraburkholderia silvatlantica]|uniref:Acetyltransferase (GNAT) family protein n=1 Tax=Paraburkholderia silvatlantica TaxID=321895 RepID=A0A2V4U4P2_9BURK|nr:GNAT family N-acetyltransferase [Paraburkholderia silvatlantica]PYE16608.1 acetyltransferase (GNAT) family protein [Paraburkholderia silvatlantica]